MTYTVTIAPDRVWASRAGPPAFASTPILTPMHRALLLCRHVLLLAAGFVATATFAQPGTGSVSGRVTDANNGSGLPGVEVRISDTAIAATTARDGHYQLSGVPAGTQTLTFSYLGYRAVERSVTVDAGATATLDAILGEEVVTLEAFKVEGVREGQARALNQQKTSGNIRNVVAADAMGNFPDRNVAESLQRIPGITTVTQRGEPLYITIRGANPGWNSVTLDGMSLLSANAAHSDSLGGDMRSVTLDVYPSAQIGSMEVVKAITPDLDGDSVGGAVLLKGKSAFDTDRRVVTASVAAGYNDLADAWGHRAAFSYSDILGSNRDWGVTFSYSHELKKELEESNETNDWFSLSTTVAGQPVTGFVPTTALQTFVDDKRTRESISGSIERKLASGGTLYIRGFRNQFDETDNRYGVRYMPGLTETGGNLDTTQPVTVSADGTIAHFSSTKASTRRLLQPQDFEDSSAGIIAGGTWITADWTLDASAAYSRAKEAFVTDQGQWNSASTSNKVTFDYSDSSFWHFQQTSGTSFFDPSGLKFNSAKHREDTSKNEEYSGKVDASRVFQVASTPVTLKAGWKSRWNTKSDDNNVANYNGILTGSLNLDDSRLGGNVAIDPSFLEGRYDFGPFVNAAAWQSFFNANRAALDNTTGTYPSPSGIFKTNANSRNATLANDFNIDEDIHAGYVRADWSWSKLELIAGVRYEKTDLNLRSTKTDASKPSTDPAAYTPYSREFSYHNWMPSVHLRYPVNDRFILRAAWSNTLARPDATSMTPNIEVDPINLTISGGNPDLHAVESQNWDVSAEYYLSSIGLVSIGAFHKSIDGPIYQNSTPIQFDNGTGPERYIYSTYLNAGSATLQGLELSYEQQLRFLPSPFDGLGFYGNYTITDSDVDVPQRPAESFTLFNQSKWLGNVALFYQKYRVSARVAYTFRSGYLTDLLGAGTDTYFDTDHRLDAQISFKVWRNWTLQLAGNNLENSPERQYHGIRARQEFYGLTGRFYSVGVSWEL